MSRNPDLPSLRALGSDLLVTTPWQRAITLLRPFVLLALYGALFALGMSWFTPLVVFLIFIAIVTSTHDVVHGSLGLGRRASDGALFVLGAFIFASGHSYRMSHLQHHRVFPGPDDPEGDPARMTLSGAVLHGPIFLPILWIWAWKRASAKERVWLVVEATWASVGVVLAIALWSVAPALTLYVALTICGSWVFPLLTVHLPHHNYGETPFTQTRTLRGRIIPALFLELTYHLEHHLYPQVPSHNLARLSTRLEPLLRKAGVKPYRVP